MSDSPEQQTATSEVVRVVSSSRSELDRAFRTILTNALQICEAELGYLAIYENGAFRVVAKVGTSAAPQKLLALFSAGEEGKGCYRVDEGLLKASVAKPGGGERILAILGPGSVVGELSMIDGAPRSASIIALRDSKLRFIRRAAFEAFVRSRPELYRHLSTLLVNRLRDTNNALVDTSFLSMKGRLARVLLRLAEAFGRHVGQGRVLIRQKVPQGDLAAMAGIARGSASRVLHDWVSRSLVSRLAGYYCLETNAAFKREAED
jgi:CRP-like cAMP-binding protein